METTASEKISASERFQDKKASNIYDLQRYSAPRLVAPLLSSTPFGMTPAIHSKC